MVEANITQAIDEKLVPLGKVPKGLVENIVRKSFSELLKKWQTTSSDEESIATFYQELPSGSSPPHLDTSPGLNNSTESGSDSLPRLPWPCIGEPNGLYDFDTEHRRSLFPAEFDVAPWTTSAEPFSLQENGKVMACDGEHLVLSHQGLCNICSGFL